MATTISISKDTRDKLKEFGTKGETYDDIINKWYEYISKKQVEELLTDTKDYVTLEDWKKELEE